MAGVRWNDATPHESGLSSLSAPLLISILVACDAADACMASVPVPSFWPPSVPLPLRGNVLPGLPESNAAVLVRTNVFFFERILRRGTDRVWVPLEFCEHRARIRSLALRPYAESGENGSWIRDIVHAPFDARSAEAGITALLREGRPVYFSTLLAFQVSFWTDLTRFLTSRFIIEPVARIGRWQLLRIRDRKPSSTLPPGISADHTS